MKTILTVLITLGSLLSSNFAIADDNQDIGMMSASSSTGSTTYFLAVGNGVASIGGLALSTSGTIALMCLKFNNNTNPISCLITTLIENITSTADNITEYLSKKNQAKNAVIALAQDDLMAVVAGNPSSYFAEQLIKLERSNLTKSGIANTSNYSDQDLASLALSEVNQMAAN